MSMRSGRWSATAVLCVLLRTSLVFAQTAPELSERSEPPLDAEQTALYLRSVDRALDEHARGHFEEAREQFQEAHALFPNARTLRGLGKVEFELRNYGESVKLLTASRQSTVRPLNAELRHEVDVLLERARAYVGEVHVDVQPGTATVRVDGVRVATGPQAALVLLVGDHVLEFHARGRLTERRQLRVHGREQINIEVSLPTPEQTPGLSRQPLQPAPSRHDDPLKRRWWLWSGAAALAVGSAVAVALAVRARNDDGDHMGGSSGVALTGP